MVRVGLVGLGFMGQQHFQIYKQMDNVEPVAVCDVIPERISEKAESIGGNIGEAEELDLSDQARYLCFDEMLANESLDLVDICTPTHLHAEMTVSALEAGNHVVCEKPMARTVTQCETMIDAAESAGKMLFIAQCIRFWPEYEVLQSLVEGGDLGDIRAARFVRKSPTPGWSSSGWLMDTELSGGALLDLHIHDVDYILSLFGMPNAVSSRAMNIVGEGEPVDHVESVYYYNDFVCSAHGGWVYPDSYPFEMGFEVLGTRALAVFSVNNDPMLQVFPFSGDPYTPDYEPGTGYENELAYFVECVEENRPPERVTPKSAKDAVRLVMAERDSIERRDKVIMG